MRRPNRRPQHLAAPPPTSPGFNALFGAVKMAFGVFVAYEGYKAFKHRPDGPVSGLGEAPAGPQQGGSYPTSAFQQGLRKTPLGKASRGNTLVSAKLYRVRDIDDRVSYIRRLLHKGSSDPRVQEVKAKVLSAKCGSSWCVPPKNAMAEIKALFNAIHDPRSPYAMRYAKDHVYIDQFTAADKLLALHSGDCDDGTVLLGALFMAAGYPVKMRVVQTKSATSWSHIYLLVNTADSNNAWIPVDWSVTNAYVGWEVPGAEAVAKTGQPAGLITKLRDFEV